MKHCSPFFEWILSILIMLLLKLTSVMTGSFAQCSVKVKDAWSCGFWDIAYQWMSIHSFCTVSTFSVPEVFFCIFCLKEFLCITAGLGLLYWLSGKEFICTAGAARDTGSIPRLGRSPEGGNGNQFQYSCLENPMDTEACGLESTGSQRVGHNWSDLAGNTHCWSWLIKKISITNTYTYIKSIKAKQNPTTSHV